LDGSFGKEAGPAIKSIVALDPFGKNVGFGNDDIITINFLEATNEPAETTKADLDNLFTFSQSLGADYTGTWLDPTRLEITITDTTGNGLPAEPINVFRVTVKESGNLKDKDETSRASVSESSPLEGNFGIKLGPTITAIIARDPDSADAIFSAGDTITVLFSEATNQTIFDPNNPAINKTSIDALLSFSQSDKVASLGADYSAIWINPFTLRITISDASGATPPAVGVLKISVEADGKLSNAAETSDISTSESPVLIGNFGKKAGPAIKSVVGDDPGETPDSVYSKDDTITIRFIEPTNQPKNKASGLTRADLDQIFTYTQNIGDDYTGEWLDSMTVRITIKDATTDRPPQIGEMRVIVKESANLKSATGASLASVAVSPTLTGGFGKFTEIIPILLGGTGTTTLPSGITTSLTLPTGQNNTLTMKRTELTTSLPGSLITSILGSVVDITPDQNTTPCSGNQTCPIEFIFNIVDAQAINVNPFDVKILHDKDNDGNFDDDGEVVDDTIITQLDENTFKATSDISSFSRFGIGKRSAAAAAPGPSAGPGPGPTAGPGAGVGVGPGAPGASGFGVILFSPLKIHEISYDVCSENMVAILVANDDAVIPTVTLQTTRSGTIEAVLATEQPFEERNRFTTIDKYLFLAPLDPKETFFMVQAKAVNNDKINAVNIAVKITECQEVIIFDEIPEEFEGIDFSAPRIFDVKIQIDNGTPQSAISPEVTYLDEQELTVSAIVNSQVPLRRAELRYVTTGQSEDDYIAFLMNITPLEGVDTNGTAVKISATIPPMFMAAPGIEYWMHVFDDDLDQVISQHYTMGVKPTYDVDSSIELDIQSSKPEGSTMRPSAYVINRVEGPTFGTVSLLVDGKVVSSTTKLFGAGQTQVTLEWVIPKEGQHMMYSIQAKLDLYGTSVTTEKASVSSFMKTQIISISEMQNILPITDQAGNTVAQPALLYASDPAHDNLRFRVIGDEGFCFISATDECAVKESTMGNRGGIQSVEHNGIIYRVAYSGVDSPLERFSITSVDQVGTNWNITLESVDDFIPQAYAVEDIHLKVKYRTTSDLITVRSESIAVDDGMGSKGTDNTLSLTESIAIDDGTGSKGTDVGRSLTESVNATSVESVINATSVEPVNATSIESVAIDDGTGSIGTGSDYSLTESVAVSDGMVSTISGTNRILTESVAVSDGTVSAIGTSSPTCQSLFCIIWSGLIP